MYHMFFKVSISTPEIVWSPALRLECLRYIEEDLKNWYDPEGPLPRGQGHGQGQGQGQGHGHYPPRNYLGKEKEDNLN